MGEGQENGERNRDVLLRCESSGYTKINTNTFNTAALNLISHDTDIHIDIDTDVDVGWVIDRICP